MSWRRSIRCQGGACVEAGSGTGVVGVRDPALRDSPVLGFTPAAWAAFTSRLKEPAPAG